MSFVLGFSKKKIVAKKKHNAHTTWIWETSSYKFILYSGVISDSLV